MDIYLQDLVSFKRFNFSLEDQFSLPLVVGRNPSLREGEIPFKLEGLDHPLYKNISATHGKFFLDRGGRLVYQDT
jgi:hypothetical protein